TKNNENCIDFYRTQEFKSSLPKKELSQIFINERTKVQNKLREKIQITSDEIEAPFNIISSLEKRNINQKQKVEYIALAPSTKLSDRRLGFMKIDDLFPLVEMEFEGLMMPCPRNSKNWLDNLYVNIDQFPHLAFEAEANLDLPYHSLVLPKGVRDKFSSDHVE
ncbi:MAG: LicD family protein, partial [Succinivibrio sp.]|nr:LicD family protein [Succinivibrio sp.]